MNKRLPLGGGVRLFFLVALALLPCTGAPGDPSPSPDWEAGVKALQSKDSQRAVTLFTDWISAAERNGIRSPEAHYNLGLAYWNLKRPGPAVYEILKSATLLSSPVAAWARLDSLDGMQNEIGIHDGLPEKLFFKIYLIGNHDVSLFLLSCAFWSIAGLLLWRWAQRRPLAFSLRALFAVPGLLGLFAAISLYNHDYLFQYGVLESEENEIPLYKNAGDPIEKKLIDLPPGTIVTWEKGEREYVRISYPVVGWIPERDLRRLD